MSETVNPVNVVRFVALVRDVHGEGYSACVECTWQTGARIRRHEVWARHNFTSLLSAMAYARREAAARNKVIGA